MNCSNHPDRSATAICSVCGKGLCNDCISSKPGLCKDCYEAYVRNKVTTAMTYFVMLIIIGIIGYKWDFMGNETYSQPGTSCYTLMAICTGRLNTDKVQPVG